MRPRPLPTRPSIVGNLLFVFFFLLWLVSMSIVCLPLLLCPRSTVLRVAKFWTRVMLGFLKVFCRLDHRVEGEQFLPAGAALVAAKHQSAWETFALLFLLPDAAIVLKRQLLWIPFYGWYARKMDHIAINRGGQAAALKSMVEGALARLAQGRQVVIFPQGTRVAPDDHNKPYHRGIAAIYGNLPKGADIAVVPVALDSGKFWFRRQFLKKPGTITLKFLPPIPCGLDRDTFMARLEDTLENAFKT